jgi:protein-disulfide isomerase
MTALGLCLFISFNLSNINIVKAEEVLSFSQSETEDIEKIIYNYLLENPEVIFEAVDKFRANEREMEEKLFSKKYDEYRDDIINDPTSPSVGPDDADVVIVEFFDYNCGYCKQAFFDVQAILKDDKNVKVIFKELPILSSGSKTAAQWALASHKQGKYWEYHSKIMKSPSKDERTLEKLAKDIGLDIKKLKKDAESTEIQEAIENNLELTRQLGIRGTPAFIINDSLARGYIGLEGMKSQIKQIRAEEG